MPSIRNLIVISAVALVGLTAGRSWSCAQELAEDAVWDVDPGGLDVDPCAYCVPSPLWMRAEYLHTWVQDSQPLPALVSRSPSGTAREAAGVLGAPGTDVLYGDQAFGGEANGVRGTFGLRLGHYFDRLADWEFEATLMWLGSTERPEGFSVDSVDEPVLARPFLDTSSGLQNAALIGYPGVVDGILSVDASSEVNSASLLMRRIVHWDDCLRLDLLAGYRYFNYSERLDMDQALFVYEGSPVEQPTEVYGNDRLGIDNRFDGCELGLVARYQRDAWQCELLGKLALGQVRQTRSAAGFTIIDPGDSGQPVVEYAHGLLAAPDRSGRFSRGDVAVLPELNLTVRRYITPEFLLSFGYTLIFLNDAIRLGDHVDPRIDAGDLDPRIPLARAPGAIDAAASAPENRATGLCIQGFHLGLEW
jgi:hypothetical protein